MHYIPLYYTCRVLYVHEFNTSLSLRFNLSINTNPFLIHFPLSGQPNFHYASTTLLLYYYYTSILLQYYILH